MMRARMRVGDFLIAYRQKIGVTHLFGIPGDLVINLFFKFGRPRGLEIVTLSHEPGIGFAADGYARATGRIGVVCVTYGAGGFNMVNPVAAAFAEKSPLVVLSGGPGKGESRSGLLLHHQAETLDSQLQIFMEITCDQARLDDARRAPADIARVLASCLRRSEPVYIEIPRDMAAEPCADSPCTTQTSSASWTALTGVCAAHAAPQPLMQASPRARSAPIGGPASGQLAPRPCASPLSR